MLLGNAGLSAIFAMSNKDKRCTKKQAAGFN
jgi:hypothetical protein